jgi:hypothetical protein
MCISFPCWTDALSDFRDHPTASAISFERRVFLSYARGDARGMAERLQDAFVRAGHRV